MDINLARTFLMVVETGSFIDAAQRLNITQSTVSARIKGLEELLGRPVFERSKTGADLTTAGEQFHKHALALIRVWQRAQLEVSLADQHRDHMAIGAPHALWLGLLLKAVSRLRKEVSDVAVSATAALPDVLTQRLIEGTLDLAVMYRPIQPPGHMVEHLFDEEFVLVTPARAQNRKGNSDYVFINWGPDFQQDHSAAYPELIKPGLSLDLGMLPIEYVLANELSGYFPARLVRAHLSRGSLRQPKRARRFVYPVYMVYPETRDEESYEPIIEALRRECAKFA